jgi:hypothetical protein
VLLADRFGGGPFLYWDPPMDQMEQLLGMLAIEGEVAQAYERYDEGEDIPGYGPDGWNDDADPFTGV